MKEITIKIDFWLIAKTLIVVLILFFYGSVLFHKINLPTDDLGRHLTNGKIIWENKNILYSNFYSYTESDFPFINHHWLSGVIFYFLFTLIGFNGLVIFKIILLLAAFSLIFHFAAKKGNFGLASLASIPAIFLLSERTDLRPEIFSLFFTALYLHLLTDFSDNPKSKKIYWLIPLQLLWVNLHVYFLIGILMAGGFVLEKIIVNLKNESPPSSRSGYLLASNNFLIKKSKKSLAIFFALIFTSLINPFGCKIFLYPLNMFKNYGYDIVENKSPFFLENLMHNPAILAFKISIVVLIIAFIVSFVFKRFPIFFFLASTATIIASSLAIRNFPFFGLIFVPSVSFGLSPLWLAWSKEIKEKIYATLKFIFPVALVAILVFLSYSALNEKIFTNKERGIGLTFQSNDSAEFFKRENLQGPIFNNYDIGSYLIWHLYPSEKIFVDNRPEAYSKEFFDNKYLPMQMNEEKWQEQSKKYNFNIIFFTQQEGTWWGQSFLAKRFQDQSWALIYADSQAAILIKNTQANEEKIKKFQITKDNIAEKINYLTSAEDIKIKLDALNLLKLINRDDLAFGICENITKNSPTESRAWLEMGYIKGKEKNAGDLIDAAKYLEKSIELGEDLPAVYNQLGLVYFNLGQFSKAKSAWQRVLDMDSENQHANDYLKQYQQFNLPQ